MKEDQSWNTYLPYLVDPQLCFIFSPLLYNISFFCTSIMISFFVNLWQEDILIALNFFEWMILKDRFKYLRMNESPLEWITITSNFIFSKRFRPVLFENRIRSYFQNSLRRLTRESRLVCKPLYKCSFLYLGENRNEISSWNSRLGCKCLYTRVFGSVREKVASW